MAAEALVVDIDRGRKADEGALRDRGAIFDRRRDDTASVAARDVLERDDARADLVIFAGQHAGIGDAGGKAGLAGEQIGRAACRERGCQVVLSWEVGGALKNTTKIKTRNKRQ